MESKLLLFTKLLNQDKIFKSLSEIISGQEMAFKFNMLNEYEEKMIYFNEIYIKDKSQENWKNYASYRGKFNSQKAAIKRHLFQKYKISIIMDTLKLNKIVSDYSLIQFLSTILDGKVLDKNVAKELVKDRNLYKNNKIPYSQQYEDMPESNKSFFKALNLSYITSFAYIPGKNGWLPVPRQPAKNNTVKKI